MSCSSFNDNGTDASLYNIIQDWECPTSGPACCQSGCNCITTILGEDPVNHDPLFVYPLDSSPTAANRPSTEAENRNYRVLWDDTDPSPAIDSGDSDIEIDFDNGYFPRDEFDIDGDTVDHVSPYELTPALQGVDDTDRVLGEHIDRGAYELPCDLTTGCFGDCVGPDFPLAPPGDGYIDGSDMAYLLGEWCETANCCPGCCSDFVTSATFLPPPDGKVDGADMAVLLGAWGTCPCDDPYAESLMGGGSEEYTTGLGPFDGTEMGELLEELIETNDSDLAAYIAELLYEMGW